MNKILKQFVIMIFVIIAILSISNVTIATTISDLNEPASNEFNKVGNAAVKSLTTIGMVLSVVTLIIIGIKYMIGSVEEKATYKQTLIPYLIGAGVIFASSLIVQIIYNFASTEL